MSYQVLARKWRPKSFREMVGQEHVLQALINALDNDRLHHAYLFTGTRGVGKTTIARILAKCLNCESGVSSVPCGTCSSCMEIAEGRSVDLLEVDAASRTKVEDTRELLENVQYAPTRSRYKVYLIDEVHMLSNHSFNALLKTLEEPPPHVKFLLATTDPQKLPATVLSRCLQFNLKNMPPEQIVGHLQNVLGQEMITFEEPALWLLGRAAGGSMRDALSLTDQAIAFGSGKVDEADVRSMLGSVDLSFVYQLLETISDGEPAKVLETVAHMAEHAPDFAGSLDELLSLLHRVALAQVVPDAIDNSWGDAERVAAIAKRLTAEDAQLFYQMALNGKRDIALAPDPRKGFEMILLRMLAFRPAAVIDDSIDAASLLEIGSVQEVANTSDAASEGGQPAKKSPQECRESEVRRQPVAPVIANETAAQSSTETAQFIATPSAPPVQPNAVATNVAPNVAIKGFELAASTPDSSGGSSPDAAQLPVGDTFSLAELSSQNWVDLLELLGLAGIVYNVASHCELRAREGDKLQFVLDENNDTLFNEGHSEKLRLALENYFGQGLQVSISAGVVGCETPAQIKERRTVARQAQAVTSIDGDQQLQALITRFDGQLDRQSIMPTDS